MAGNNLAVKITADIVDLQTKFAVAKAEVSGLSSEMNKLARASVNGGLDAQASARLQQVSGDLLRARQGAAQLGTALQETGVASSVMGGATREMHGSISTATREFRALFDELSSGRTRMTPGTLAIIAQRVFGLSGATLAAVGGVAALAAGLGYLAYKALEASNAVDEMHLDALRAGSGVTRDELQGLVRELAQLPSVAESDAQEINAALAKLPLPFAAMSAAARIAGEQMEQTRQSAKDVGEELAKALEPTRTSLEVAKGIEGITQAEINAAAAADKSGNANAILAEKLSLLSAPLTRARKDVDEYRVSVGSTLAHAIEIAGLSQANLYSSFSGMAAQNPIAQVARQGTTAWQQNAAAIRDAIAAIRSLPAVKPLDFNLDKDSSAQLAMIREITQARHDAVEDRARIVMEEFQQNESYFNQLVAADEQAEEARTRAAIEGAKVRLDNAHQEIVESSALLKQTIQQENEDDKQREEQYKQMVRGMESAETSFIRNVLAGRQSMTQNLKSLALSLAQNEIAAAARAATQKILLYGQSAAQEKSISSALGMKTVMQDAAKAYAGTYSSVAQIPYVGWILAPAAGAAAYAAVAAYQGMASLDVGTMSIPQTGLYQLHEGEAVMPKPWAQGMRDGDMPGMGGATHHNYGGTWNVNLNDTDMKRMLSSASGQRQVMNALASAWRRGARP